MLAQAQPLASFHSISPLAVRASNMRATNTPCSVSCWRKATTESGLESTNASRALARARFAGCGDWVVDGGLKHPNRLASMSDSGREMMAQILIRQLDERVVEILRAQAKRRGVSLEQNLRDLLTSVAAEQDDRLERLAALRRQTPAAGRQLDVATLIQEGREQR